MICKNCGSEVTNGSNFCPKCGWLISEDDIVYQDYNQNNDLDIDNMPIDATTKKPKSKAKIIIPIVCVIIFVAVIAVVFAFFGIDSSDDALTYESDLNYVSLDDNFTDVKVTDEASALEAVNSVASQLKIDNDKSELQLTDVSNVGDTAYYRMQLYYDGYPVYGKTVSIQADKDGNATALTANTIQISLENNVTTDTQEVEESLYSYFSSENIQMQELTNDCIVVYKPDNSDICVLAYDIYISADSEIYEVLIDASTAEILTCNTFFSNADAQVSDKNETVTATGWEENGMYSLYNEERNISVFDFSKQSDSDIASFVLNLFSPFSTSVGDISADFTDYGFSVIESKKSNNFETQAVTLLNEVEFFNDYFCELGHPGFEQIHTAINDSYDKGNNARGGAAYEKGKMCAILSVGKNTGTSAVDVLAHEYTHGITDSKVDFSDTDNNKNPGAICEAYSDIFGEIIEMKIEGTDEPDWINAANTEAVGNRDIIGVSETSSTQLYNYSDYNDDTNECHKASTIISHAAYLMWNGIDGNENKKIDVDMLAEIWYGSLSMINSDATFSQCADAVYKSAKAVDGITEEQLACVAEAFNQVGISYEADTSVSEETTSQTETADDELIPTDEDFELFESMIKQTPWTWLTINEFDFENATVEDVVNSDGIFTNACGSELYDYFFDDSTFIEQDPKNKWNPEYASYRFSTENFNWLLENVFEVAPDESIDYEKFYYDGDYCYYRCLDGGGGFDYYYSLNSSYDLNGYWGIIVDLEIVTDDGDSTTDKLYYVAKLKNDNEIGNYWSLQKYSNNTPCFDIPEEETVDVNLDAIPGEYIFCSGVGNWQTSLIISDDYTFTGTYYDLNMGDYGEEYPDGTEYLCEFYGNFYAPEKIDDYTYKLKIEFIALKYEDGYTFYDDGIRYICTDEIYGLDGCKELYLYLSGRSVDDFSDDFLYWIQFYYDDNNILTGEVILNPKDDLGFFKN